MPSVLNVWKTVVIVLLVSIVNYGALLSILGYRSIGFIFLLMVLIIGVFGNISSIVVAAMSSALVWDFFFIPPQFTFVISEPEDVFMMFSFFISALITGFYANRVRLNEVVINEREQHAKTLYEVLKDITSGQENLEFLKKVSDRVGRLFSGECTIIPISIDGTLCFSDYSSIGSQTINDKDKSIIEWSFKNNLRAGWSAETLNSSRSLFIPICGESECVGIFIFKPTDREIPLSADKNRLLSAIVHQLGVSLERNFLSKKLEESRKIRESELLHQTILNSISHEIKTPLTVISGSVSVLENNATVGDSINFNQIVCNLRDASDRLSQVVENLLDMSRISSGQLKLHLEWHDMSDLVGVALRKLSKSLGDHRLMIENFSTIPLLKFDFRLMEHAVYNLVLNAVLYSPPATKITIKMGKTDDQPQEYFVLVIEDQGAGIAHAYAGKIFDKFFRIPGSPTGGTGLGLSIAKDIIELHQGKITVENIEPHGARFIIKLPVEKQPETDGVKKIE